MINLASLSALLRTLRQAGGPDGPSVPVARVTPVVSLTRDDRPGTQSGTSAVQSWSSSQARNAALLDDELLSTPVVRREGRETVPSTRVPPSAPQSHADSTSLQLTVGGRVLQTVLRASESALPTPPAVVSHVPLVPSAQSPAIDVARGLAQAVTESGLFYESHLAKWVRREYPDSAIAREPQASWTAAVAGVAEPGGPPVLSDANAQFVTRQLDAFDTRAIVWTGEIWPGQRASISIEEEDARDEDEAPPAAAMRGGTWRTRIVLDLPALGRVQATVALAGDALDLMLEADTKQARARLAQAHDLLTAAMAGTRVHLRHFAVGNAVGG